ncbi:MAG: DUF362 domain-containing protein [Thermodesulfobacteriota bacterium]
MKSKNSAAKIPVILARSQAYDSKKLCAQFHSHLDLLGVPADLSRRRILLKPNLISAAAPALACSDPIFVAAAAACFLERGANLMLGDSPAFGSAGQVLKSKGFTGSLAAMDIDYVPFRRRVRKTLACGISVTVAAEALDCDLFVNLPRVKAHEQMGVTMAVKNVFGVVIGARKAWLHMRHGSSHVQFARMILDLTQILPPTLVLADGIEVMSRRGPVHGSPLSLGCVAAARNCVALDRAMLEVLGVDRGRVPLARVAREQALPGALLSEIEFPQLTPRAFAGSGFQVPDNLNPVRFRPFRYLFSSLKRVVAG